jgi:hypothetical protein
VHVTHVQLTARVLLGGDSVLSVWFKPGQTPERSKRPPLGEEELARRERLGLSNSDL